MFQNIFPTPASIARGGYNTVSLDINEILAAIRHGILLHGEVGMVNINFNELMWRWTCDRILSPEGFIKIQNILEDAGWMVLFEYEEAEPPKYCEGQEGWVKINGITISPQ